MFIKLPKPVPLFAIDTVLVVLVMLEVIDDEVATRDPLKNSL
jgi:hypothetical protein